MEIINAVVHDIGYAILPVLEDTARDVNLTCTFYSHVAHGKTLTVPVEYQYIGVLTSSKPNGHDADMFGALKPFSFVVWIGVVLVVVVRKLLSFLKESEGRLFT